MADNPISLLTAAGASDGTEPAGVVQSGSTVKMTVDQYAARTETRAQQSVRVRASVVQSIPDVTFTDVNFDIADFDHGGQHDPGVNNERITPTVAGVWLFTVVMEFAANATGQRRLRLLLNGVTNVGMVVVDAAAVGVTSLSVSTMVQVNGTTDFVTASVYQDSTAALNVVNGQRSNFCASLMHRT